MKSLSTIILFLLAFAIADANAQEKHLKNIVRLTNGGDNAEAYFSPDGKLLTMQVTNKNLGAQCDQIFLYDLANQEHGSKNLKLVSTGKGRTTCSYFMPDGKHVLYASTHDASSECPAPPKSTDGKYLWAIYPEFDIYMADLNGTIVKRLTDSPGYDAEAVVSPDGKKIAFTSVRSGDLELWTMDIDGSNLKQVTNGLGYDGGCFFSHDSKKLVFRSSRPKTEEAIKEYKDLLAKNLVAPTEMEIYTCNVDGSELRQITHLGKANWAPFFHPSDKKIIFSSNHHSTRGYDFQLYMIDTDGSNLEQITFTSEFNAFPMFSPDGKKLVFSSNRQQDAPRETNVFIADWVDGDAAEKAQPTNLKKDISFLASDDLKGRLAGSAEETLAANYLAEQFKNLGLKPYQKKSFFQDFDYKVNLNPHDATAGSEENTGKNVIAYLNNKASKTIIIGAHYDHLGLNQHHNSTKANSFGEIHNGADDNASGVAGVLELARMLSQNNTTEEANYIFALFSAEEDGLMGSKHMAAGLKKLYPNVVAMINMDMIGRLNDAKEMTVGGIGTCADFRMIVERNKPAGFNITLDESGIGPSDHTSFYLKDIPVLFFFTGTHQDYHKPSDDENKINYVGVTNIVDYVFRVCRDIEKLQKVTFSKTKNTATRETPKYKVTMGVMPDYTDHGDGLHIDGVMDGRPAHKAGLESGDILTRIGDCPIKDVYAYMDCLAKFNAGDTVEVAFIRNGVAKVSQITF